MIKHYDQGILEERLFELWFPRVRCEMVGTVWQQVAGMVPGSSHLRANDLNCKQEAENEN